MQIGCGVIYKDNKILLIKKAYGTYKDKWEFPGGKRDPSDPSLKYCLARELLEEINCDVKVHELIYYMKIKKEQVNLAKDLDLFFYNIQLLTYKIKLSKEHTDFKWVSFSEARNMDLIKWDYKLLSYFDDYFNNNPNVVVPVTDFLNLNLD